MATERLPHADEPPVTVRRLSDDEARRAGISDSDMTIVARQGNTEEFLAFLDTLPAADAVVPQNDADPR